MGRFDDRFVYMCVRKRVSVTVCVSVSARDCESVSACPRASVYVRLYACVFVLVPYFCYWAVWLWLVVCLAMRVEETALL